MKKLLYLAVLPFFFYFCSVSKDVSSDATRDGSSFKTAIIIHETSESPGVAAEYEWLKLKYPGYTFESQALAFHKKHPYDIIRFQTMFGTEKEIYFDISNFFGK